MNNRGFTLIETVVAVALTAFISVALGVLISYFYKTNEYTLEQSTAVNEARLGVESAMSALREASYGADGSYPVGAAATSSITFYADVVGNSTIERVTYELIGATLYRVVATASGNPLSYAGATLATSTIATSVVNTSSAPLFRYFDDTGTELATPIDIGAIASVETTVVVDVNVNRAPVSFTLSGAATLRNLKDQP